MRSLNDYVAGFREVLLKESIQDAIAAAIELIETIRKVTDTPPDEIFGRIPQTIGVDGVARLEEVVTKLVQAGLTESSEDPTRTEFAVSCLCIGARVLRFCNGAAWVPVKDKVTEIVNDVPVFDRWLLEEKVRSRNLLLACLRLLVETKYCNMGFWHDFLAIDKRLNRAVYLVNDDSVHHSFVGLLARGLFNTVPLESYFKWIARLEQGIAGLGLPFAARDGHTRAFVLVRDATLFGIMGRFRNAPTEECEQMRVQLEAIKSPERTVELAEQSLRLIVPNSILEQAHAAGHLYPRLQITIE